jgi:hypothetical protein
MKIRVGDYVTTEFNRGYLRVEKCVLINHINPQTSKAEEITWLLLKKALNDKFECKNLVADTVHEYLCKKVDDATREKIEIVFSENLKAKTKFDEFPVSTKGILHIGVACNEIEEVELHKTMQKIKNSDLTEEEIYNVPIIKKYKFKGLYGDDVKYKKICPSCFINTNIETNKKNWRIFKLHSYGQDDYLITLN